ncbi:MAG TPA: hypothetical protein DCL21_04495 [Alphaproteobacteria bacterium]|nr:hypothetical protein [Alphaproteobacteria bacterium]
MITKTIFYFALLFIAAFLIVQGVQSPGELTISWFDYYIEVNIMFAIVAVILFIFLVQTMMHLLTLLGFLPSVIKYRSENKKLKTGLENLKAIALNLSLGNKDKAKKMAKKNQKVIPEYPVFDEMLDVKSKNDLTNDIVDIRMAKNKVEEFLNNYDNDKALKIVENILNEHPDSTWAKQKQYQILLALEEFDSALNILKILKKDKLVSKEQFNLEKSFILYEMALNEEDPLESLKLAEAGMKSQANFIKLVELSAVIFVETEQAEKALKLLISLSKNFNQCLATFDTFKQLVEKLPVDDQIKWLNKYSKVNSDFAGCLIAKAQSLVLQEKFDDAISFLETRTKTKETLLVLSQIHKSNGDNVQSIKYLELANNLEYLDKQDLVKEYHLWQGHNLNMNDRSEQVCINETNNEGLLLK